ncbi:hypothetical protein [Streptobacillus canis]|uniref:hypothetical protein n=1 Tax=Streptobacillus canis TaxID=2678686 RepID=UPI0012E1D5C0|nr:hypothetical protein [Streptobacillus canis]
MIDKLKELDRQVTESPVNKENYENVVDQRVIPSGDFTVLFPIEVKEKIKVKLGGGLGIGYSKAILTQQSKLTKDFHEEILDITVGWFHSGCVLGENEKLTNPEKQCDPEIVYMINRAFKERIKIANYQSFGYFQVYATGEVGAKVLKDLEAFGGVNLGYNVAFDKAVRMSSYFPKFGIKGNIFR